MKHGCHNAFTHRKYREKSIFVHLAAIVGTDISGAQAEKLFSVAVNGKLTAALFPGSYTVIEYLLKFLFQSHFFISYLCPVLQ